MKTMIVGMSYNTDGTRYITFILYNNFADMIDVKDICESLKRSNDEIYAIDLNANHTDFIQEIVLHGCRM